MGLTSSFSIGQTPLTEEESDGLLLFSIATRDQLDDVEQRNIEKALVQLLRRPPKKEEVLSLEFVKRLHRMMYSDVWSWAGEYRRTEKNIGVSWTEISSATRALIDDAQYWREHSTYPADEAALHFKHRLVSIHCFPNGNGRHSRLMADTIAEVLYGRPIFRWKGKGNLGSKEMRSEYLNALRSADRGDIQPLHDFARGE